MCNVYRIASVRQYSIAYIQLHYIATEGSPIAFVYFYNIFLYSFKIQLRNTSHN